MQASLVRRNGEHQFTLWSEEAGYHQVIWFPHDKNPADLAEEIAVAINDVAARERKTK